jgi:hypothetical protein
MAKDIQILSWNVNGLLRKISDPDFLNSVTDNDLIFLHKKMLTLI